MRQQTANNPERVPELGVLFVATMNVAIPLIATQSPDNWVAKSVATFRGFPVCGSGATLTSDLAFAGGIALTVSDLGRTMQRFELAMRGASATCLIWNDC